MSAAPTPTQRALLEQAAEHITTTLAARPGTPTSRFVRACGLSENVVRRVLRLHETGEPGWITRSTAERILAVTPDDLGPEPSAAPPAPDCKARSGTGDTKCTCSPECRERHRRARAAQRARNARGIPGVIPAKDCAAYIRQVLVFAPQATRTDFARAADITERTLRTILAEGEAGVRPKTAERIFAVTPEDLPHHDGQRLVSPDQARVWLDELTALGWTRKQIAGAAGLHESAIFDCVLRERSGITAGTAERIWGARKTLGRPNPSRRSSVEVTLERRVLASRQLEALAALGWSAGHLRREFGVPQGTGHGLRDPRARRRNLAPVGEAYRALSLTAGPSDVVRDYARRQGFVPPLAWDDSAMSDPSGVPDFAVISDRKWRRAAKARYRSQETMGWLWVPPGRSEDQPDAQ